MPTEDNLNKLMTLRTDNTLDNILNTTQSTTGSGWVEYLNGYDPTLNRPISGQPKTPTYNPYVNIPGSTIPPTTRIPSNDWQKDLESQLLWGPVRSNFYKTLEDLFTFEEMWDYLQGIGYKHTMGDKEIEVKINTAIWIPIINEDGSYAYTGSYDNVATAFEKEMKIKFKNLLLSKSTLKLKI